MNSNAIALRCVVIGEGDARPVGSGPRTRGGETPPRVVIRGEYMRKPYYARANWLFAHAGLSYAGIDLSGAVQTRGCFVGEN